MLEAWRDRLYNEMPVPEGWHEAYANGEINIDEYRPDGDFLLHDEGAANHEKH